MIDSQEIERLLESRANNIICDPFCFLPSNIAVYIDAVAQSKEEFGYVIIGVEGRTGDYNVCGINSVVNFEVVYQSAIEKSKLRPETEQKIHTVRGKRVWVVSVKTIKLIEKNKENYSVIKIVRDIFEACIKLQSNAIFYTASEDQRNDYIRDLLETGGYQVKDQTRRGSSPAGKAAGEVDILIHNSGIPIAIIEALNLSSLNSTYLDKHINKIYNYDTAGNKFNVILSYVSVKNFEMFWIGYCEHIKSYQYPFQLIGVEENDNILNTFSDIKLITTKHNRNGMETFLYHCCVRIG